MASTDRDRIGIVGASSLAGKELSDEVADSSLAAADLLLLDDDDAAGQLTSAGDEPALVRQIEPSSFEGLDFVFFAGSPELTRAHWQIARRAGASVVDETYALEDEPDIPVRAPWVQPPAGAVEARRPDLNTPAVVPAHPVALMLALTAVPLHDLFGLRSLSATVLEPASEHGRLAMDELHQQTVSLLSFQPLPREVYDAQVAFNILSALGPEAKVRLDEVARRIGKHWAILIGGALPELALQVVHAPVFHGYAVSLLVELSRPATITEVEHALGRDHVDLISGTPRMSGASGISGISGMSGTSGASEGQTDDQSEGQTEGQSDPPSNLSAAGQKDVLVQVTDARASAFPSPAPDPPTGQTSSQMPDQKSDRTPDQKSDRFWLWLAADNLRLAAANAISCAAELRRLRPQGKVQ